MVTARAAPRELRRRASRATGARSSTSPGRWCSAAPASCVMAIADVVMVGRYDTEALAALSLGYAVVDAAARHRHRLHGRRHRHHRARARRRQPRRCRRSRCAACTGRSRSARVAGLLCLARRAGAAADRPGARARRRRRRGRADVRARHALPDRLRRRELLSRGHRPAAAGPRRDGRRQRAERRAQLADDRRPPRRSRRWAPRARRSPPRSPALAMVAGLLVWMLRLPEFAPWRGRLRLWGPGGWRGRRRDAPDRLRRRRRLLLRDRRLRQRSPRRRACSAPTALAAYTILHNIEAHGLHDRARRLGRRPRCGSARPPAPATAAEARFAGLAGARRRDGPRRRCSASRSSPPRRRSSASTAPTRR